MDADNDFNDGDDNNNDYNNNHNYNTNNTNNDNNNTDNITSNDEAASMIMMTIDCALTYVIRSKMTAVHFAALFNHPACLKTLLSSKADVNTRTKYACLDFCCCCKRDVKLFRRFGETPLNRARETWAQRVRGLTECIALLEAAGAL
jgi:hypothetical protein